jgi:hypothetical protein
MKEIYFKRRKVNYLHDVLYLKVFQKRNESIMLVHQVNKSKALFELLRRLKEERKSLVEHKKRLKPKLDSYNVSIDKPVEYPE